MNKIAEQLMRLLLSESITEKDFTGFLMINPTNNRCDCVQVTLSPQNE